MQNHARAELCEGGQAEGWVDVCSGVAWYPKEARLASSAAVCEIWESFTKLLLRVKEICADACSHSVSNIVSMHPLRPSSQEKIIDFRTAEDYAEPVAEVYYTRPGCGHQ